MRALPQGWPPHTSARCAPKQLHLHLAGPQTAAHGRKGTQPQTENNNSARAELGG